MQIYLFTTIANCKVMSVYAIYQQVHFETPVLTHKRINRITSAHLNEIIFIKLHFEFCTSWLLQFVFKLLF